MITSQPQSILPFDLSGVHVHFVGIKGTGMTALVEIFASRKAFITGSDVEEVFYTDAILEKLGIKPLPFSQKNITESVRFVVYSSAYSPETNPDLKEAKEKGVPLLLYSEALGELSRSSYSSGICGVHGKTTTTALTGTILKSLPLSSQVLAGSVIPSFGGSCTLTIGGSESEGGKSFSSSSQKYFVAETCEYQRHFMSFSPKNIILTSVESDHQDFYPTFSDIQKAFIDYICLLPQGGNLIFCADDKGAKETAFLAKEKRNDIVLIPYGESAEGDYKVTFKKTENGKQTFDVFCLGEVSLLVPGKHNALNATAAIALCFSLLKVERKNPLDFAEKIKKSLLDFSGGKRRSEIVAKKKNSFGDEILFIDDYAHHPTAIEKTLSGYREFFTGKKLIVDFMSHTYTRTAALLDEFSKSFSSADMVVINKIYGSARENQSTSGVTGLLLAEKTKEHHKCVFYAEEFSEAAEIISKELSKKSTEENGYVFVTMGAGDNWKVGQLVLEKF